MDQNQQNNTTQGIVIPWKEILIGALIGVAADRVVTNVSNNRRNKRIANPDIVYDTDPQSW